MSFVDEMRECGFAICQNKQGVFIEPQDRRTAKLIEWIKNKKTAIAHELLDEAATVLRHWPRK